MSIAYYTVQPYPAASPKAFIVRIFKDTDDKTHCLDTRCVPVRNPHNVARSLNDARLLGDSIVKSLVL